MVPTTLNKWCKVATVAATIAVAGMALADRGDRNEKTVKMSALPAAVKTTLEKVASGGRITELTVDHKHGKKVYEADARINHKKYEIKIKANGTLISEKLDRGDGDGH